MAESVAESVTGIDVPEPTDAQVEAYFASEGENMGGEAAEVAKAEQPVETPEQQAEAPEPQAEKPPAGHVPLAALQEERERRKELQARLEALERAMQQKPAEPEDPEPDKDHDYAGWLEWRARQNEKRLEQIEREAQALKARQEQAVALAAVKRTVEQMEAQYRSEKPDYDAAYDYAIAHERRRLAEVEGITDKAVQDRVIAQLEQQLVVSALQSGRNPADVVYRYALVAGYQPGGAKATPERVAAEVAAGGLTGAKSVPKSLGAARTAPAGNGLTPEAIAAMSEAEFAKLAATAAGRSAINKVMGEGFLSEY